MKPVSFDDKENMVLPLRIHIQELDKDYNHCDHKPYAAQIRIHPMDETKKNYYYDLLCERGEM